MAFTNFGGMVQLAGFAVIGATGVAPNGYLRMDGQLVLMTDYPDLYTLYGTTFGGDGITTFGIPNALGCTFVGAGSGVGRLPYPYPLGSKTGEATHVLTASELPVHNHNFIAITDAGDVAIGTANSLASSAMFQTGSGGGALNSTAMGSVGLAVPTHDNNQPYTEITAFVAYQDVAPDVYTGELRFVPFAAPSGWYDCNGASLSVTGDVALFNAIGYAFTPGPTGAFFNLPDGRGLVLLGAGSGTGLTPHALGASGGVETVALTTDQMPSHTHPVYVTLAGGNVSVATGHVLGKTVNQYKMTGATGTMSSDTVRSAGSGAAHNNLMPQIAMNMIIKK